ncbi:MAG: aminotransferase class V-fold PLP-dependent enzyme [Candidatus Micrarchaeia archaeon]
MGLNIEKIRADFPILSKKINGKNVIYFDNACQTLRPIQVIRKMNEYYEEYPACVGRSNHKFGEKATEEVESARKKIANFFNAKPNEIIITRNTTEGINLISHSFNFKEGDSVLVSDKEHNSNLIPWQMLKKKGIKLKFFRFGDIEDFQNKIDKSVKLAAFVHTSNIDGTTQQIEKMIKIAHDNKIFTLVDAAQSAPHKKIDVKKLNPDALACSGHKMLGPSGTGILYLSENSVSNLSEFMTGGETVVNSTYESVEFEKLPNKYEAGLQNYSGIIGLGAATEYLKSVGLERIEAHESELNQIITNGLEEEIENGYIQLLGPKEAKLRSGIFSFNIKGMTYHQISLLLDKSENIMIRSGQHCVHSWFNANNIDGSARASLYLYNTKEEANTFVEAVKRLVKFVK